MRAATGFAIGGTPPFGYLTQLFTWIDEDLLVYETVWAAAGTSDSCFSMSPTRLTKISNMG
ncbi:YbaK/EbsC family protein [Candidatus Poriferisocius sp.]|uniref:YbaK/EbsC family protein n=1 Tax=Candidatus Poriferisocius sp. TaxID=3101276 RepID=UPI003B021740